MIEQGEATQGILSSVTAASKHCWLGAFQMCMFGATSIALRITRHAKKQPC